MGLRKVPLPRSALRWPSMPRTHWASDEAAASNRNAAATIAACFRNMFLEPRTMGLESSTPGRPLSFLLGHHGSEPQGPHHGRRTGLHPQLLVHPLQVLVD